MRLYFEDTKGRRLAIDTGAEVYAADFLPGAGVIPDRFRRERRETLKDI